MVTTVPTLCSNDAHCEETIFRQIQTSQLSFSLIVRHPRAWFYDNPDIETEWDFIAEIGYIGLWDHKTGCCPSGNFGQLFLWRHNDVTSIASPGRHQEAIKYIKFSQNIGMFGIILKIISSGVWKCKDNLLSCLRFER